MYFQSYSAYLGDPGESQLVYIRVCALFGTQQKRRMAEIIGKHRKTQHTTGILELPTAQDGLEGPQRGPDLGRGLG